MLKKQNYKEYDYNKYKVNSNILAEGYLPIRFVWHNIKNFFKRFKMAYQRAIYGVCEEDTWDLSYYMINMLYNGLFYLAENSHGYPGCAPWEWQELWSLYLKRLANLMRRSNEMYEDDYYEEIDFDNTTLEERCAEWDERELKREEDIDLWFSMLTKCYRHLWD